MTYTDPVRYPNALEQADPEGALNTYVIDNIDNLGVRVTALESGGGGGGVETGATVFVDPDSIPAGYLECNGAAVSRTTYSDLFNKIGISFGPGDGSTTFNLPNNFPIFQFQRNVDAEFANTPVNNAVRAVAIQPDGKILIGGDFNLVNGVSMTKVARFNADGTIDATFNDPVITANLVYAIAVQSDGKILIGGTFTSVNGSTLQRLARLNSDGSVDVSFNNPAITDGIVNSIEIQNDGKILVAGSFTTASATTRNRVARFNSDGTLDAAYNPDVNNTVNVIKILSTGKTFIGGNFNLVGALTRNSAAILDATGALDPSFPTPGISGNVVSVAEQQDGKLVIGGTFTNIQGYVRGRLARIQSDGTIDTSFPDLNAGSNVNAIVIDSNNQIIFSGNMTSVLGNVQKRVARVSQSGVLDLNFDPTAGGTVNALALQNDGKLVIGGSFTSSCDQARPYFTRVTPNGGILVSVIKT